MRWDFLCLTDPSPSSREVMRAFYKRLFPYKAVYRWLNQGDGE